MIREDIKPDLRVKTTYIEFWSKILADPAYLECRKEGQTGTIIKPVTDHYGAWWIRHDDGKSAPYWYYEFNLLQEEKIKPTRMFDD